MIRNRVTTGTRMACFSLLLFANMPIETYAATRCPAGEVFRASRGTCQPKEAAASEGIFSFWPFSSKREEAETPVAEKAKIQRQKRAVSVAPAKAAPASAVSASAASAAVVAPAKPTAKAAALIQIEKRAPLAAKPEAALGFSSAANPVPLTEPLVARPVQAIPVTVKSREISPFGSLIAFEPVTR